MGGYHVEVDGLQWLAQGLVNRAQRLVCIGHVGRQPDHVTQLPHCLRVPAGSGNLSPTSERAALAINCHGPQCDASVRDATCQPCPKTRDRPASDVSRGTLFGGIQQVGLPQSSVRQPQARPLYACQQLRSAPCVTAADWAWAAAAGSTVPGLTLRAHDFVLCVPPPATGPMGSSLHR